MFVTDDTQQLHVCFLHPDRDLTGKQPEGTSPLLFNYILLFSFSAEKQE